MKSNFNFRLPGFLYLMMCMILISSCSTEVIESEETNSSATEKQKEILTEEFALETKTYLDNSCETTCVLEGGWDIPKKSGYARVNVGPNTKEMSYTVYNTESHFVVEVLYEITSESAKVDANITITVNGDQKISDKVKNGDTVTHSFALQEDYRACDVIKYHIKQVAYGAPVIFEGEYKLIPTCEETAPAVGQKRYGGIITHVLREGDYGYDPEVPHGIIAAPQPLPGLYPWANSNYFPQPTSFGDGKYNTSEIVNYFGEGVYAAKVCDDYEFNGFDDWYLPSATELRWVIQIGSFITNEKFWSSTAANFDEAFTWERNVPWAQIDYFQYNYKVWPFRSF